MTDSAQPNQDQSFGSAGDKPQVSSGSPAPGKELEGGITLGEPFPLKDIGTHEVDLPKEVVAVGVSSRPTNVKLPPAVQQLGVRVTGQTSPSARAPSVALPLTDDQIAQGLRYGITNSWRWLSEWCVRKIKQLHRTLRKESTNKQIYK